MSDVWFIFRLKYSIYSLRELYFILQTTRRLMNAWIKLMRYCTSSKAQNNWFETVVLYNLRKICKLSYVRQMQSVVVEA